MATQTGYKASELGMIPQDWEIRRIGDFAPLQRGFDLPNSEIQSGDYPVVYSNGIGNYHNRYTVKSPCIATGRSGTLGKVHYVEQDCWVHNTSLWVTKFDNCEPKFIYFLFQKIGFERFASGSGVPTLNRNDAHEFKIALPKSITEQTAIATALSDTDALISSLQTLIAKKQAIKLSAMQNLLSGKIRLPEFAKRPDGSSKTTRQTELGCVPEDWEVVELGEVLSYEQPGKYIIHNDDLKVGDIPVLTAGKTFILGYTIEDFNCYENYPVIIFDDFTTDSKLVNFRFKVKSSAMKMLKPKKNDMPIELIFMLLQNINFIVGDHKRHWISEFQHLKIAIPKSPTEQTAIAQLLSDMDAEIEALECRLKKTQSLKQGMMQALLTGKTRLPLE